jgi:hypothetical protein
VAIPTDELRRKDHPDLGFLLVTYGLREQPPASSRYDVALVRDGRIAVLYTLLNRASPKSESARTAL